MKQFVPPYIASTQRLSSTRPPTFIGAWAAALAQVEARVNNAALARPLLVVPCAAPHTGLLAGLVAGGAWRPFTWRSGVITPIDVPDANVSAGYGLNNWGDVTGHFTRPGNTKMSGFRIGPSGSVTFSHPAAGTTMMSCGWGIGAKGEVVGHYQDPDTRIVYGYLWGGDGFVDTLRVPAARETYPSGITSTGLVSGYFVAADGLVHGFIATPPGHPWGEKP
jgi:hypothetical protein